ncbi:MAG: 3-oxoacyl-[acyl-carrier-protein] reductase [Alphaproteobacteria bacterium CG_4_10_14_0_2_um_filter_63_37]|nr:MAG: 3-oxoacyl-[acyl-carrier-protein] reductase [Proteobacteria bacterium CG1_02_64_396]PJA25275.1 MAG: 3-oxoacyl-[acyl-carrier-protein] reductase [Alphaproteobacteria bacterium CG_4_10_14_0_2_um_filter_63_37]
MSLQGLSVVVTGASSGIGKEVALHLAKAGCRLTLTGTNQERLDQVKGQVAELGAEVVTVAVDLNADGAADQVINAALEAFGALDGLVNNAGITRDTLLVRMKDDDWDAVIGTNLTAPFKLLRAAAKVMMKARSGSVVNVSSIVASTGNAGQTNYTAAKGGVEAMTRTVALELASRGVRVNAVAPGFIETPMTEVLPEKVKAALLDNIPMKRMGKPEEIADLIEFLLSPKSSYITGQTLHVNGGMYLG